MIIYSQTLESLNNGDLNGQAGWSGDTSFQVQTDLVHLGSKALVSAGSFGKQITKDITQHKNSVLSAYLRTSIASASCFLTLASPTGENIGHIEVTTTDINLYYYDPVAEDISFVKIANGGIDEWFEVKLEWDTVNKKIRASVNNGVWSDWYDQEVDSVENAGQITLSQFWFFEGALYFDDILVVSGNSGFFF